MCVGQEQRIIPPTFVSAYYVLGTIGNANANNQSLRHGLKGSPSSRKEN